MKKLLLYSILMLLSMAVFFSSCKKDAAIKTSITTATTGTITLGVLATTSNSGTTTKDTLMLVNCFGPKSKPDSIAFSALPAAVGTYLIGNYAGYTFNKAFAVDSAKGITAYIVVIKYNSNFVGLKFDTSGNFVKVLEQRDQADNRKGQGLHLGGPFGDRSAPQKDTIAISAIPTVVKSAFTSKYAADTLLHALITPDTTYILISKDNGLFITAISKTGTLLQRQAMPKPQAGVSQLTAVAQSNLPSAVTTYLNTTYPSYVFNKAFSVKVKSVLQGYDVFITANNTKYVVNFNGSGTFVNAITLH